jgi:transcriptional regulator with XRE-family HTH domain
VVKRKAAPEAAIQNDSGDAGWLAAFGAAVRSARLDKQMTQKQLAAASGVSRQKIVGIEGGKVENFRMSTARRLANALGADVTNLLPK